MRSKHSLIFFTLLIPVFFFSGLSKLFALESGSAFNGARSYGQLYVSERITEKGIFTSGIEGPAVDRDGNLYVVNFGKSGTIGRLIPGQTFTLWLTLPQGSIANSIRVDSSGQLFVADYKKHKVFKVDRHTRELEVALHAPTMNQPNDMTISAKGDIFLSDPAWSDAKIGSIWKLDTDGHARKLANDLKAVNGIALSPDEKKLYYSESIEGKLYSYELNSGNLSNRKLLRAFSPDSVDGIKTDIRGNIYIARYGLGRIDMLDAEGRPIRSILLHGKEPTNLAFGGSDGKTVYVTNSDGGFVEAFLAETPGLEWEIQRAKQP